MRDEQNTITVEMTVILKNTFGFFYRENGYFWIYGPWEWDHAPAKPPAGAEYFLLDYGLLEPFDLIVISTVV